MRGWFKRNVKDEVRTKREDAFEDNEESRETNGRSKGLRTNTLSE